MTTHTQICTLYSIHCEVHERHESQTNTHGESRGVWIPKPLIYEAGLQDDVHLRVVGAAILIQSDSPVRAGWGDAAKEIVGRGADGLTDEELPTDFDEPEWDWE